MTTGQAVVPRNRRPGDPAGRNRSAKNLPEYLEVHQVEALIRVCPPQSRVVTGPASAEHVSEV